MIKSKTNKKNKFFYQVVKRWRSETPRFWKKIREFAIILGTSAVGVLGADQLFNLQAQYGLPQIIFTIAGYVVVFCAALGLSAQITKKDNNDDDTN